MNMKRKRDKKCEYEKKWEGYRTDEEGKREYEKEWEWYQPDEVGNQCKMYEMDGPSET